MDGAGSAYVTGETPPATSRPRRAPSTELQRAAGDVFVVKLNPAASTLGLRHLPGRNSTDYGYDIAVDGAGSAYVTGTT